MRAFVAILLLKTLALLPLRAARGLGRFVGSLVYRSSPRGAITSRQNVAVAFPELSAPQQAELARASYLETWALWFEGGATWMWPRSRLERTIVSVQGLEQLEAAAAAAEPVVILLPHLGNWELLAEVFGRRLTIVALYELPSDPGMDALVRRFRERLGATLAPMTVSGLRLVRQTLQQGGTVAILPDQVPGKRSGVHAEFFGLPALTMTLPHRLVTEHDARCFIAACTRCPEGFRVEIAPAPDAIAEPDPTTAASAMNAAIEALVRRHPEQYQWEYKRFKHLPEGYSPVYPKVGPKQNVSTNYASTKNSKKR